MGVFILGLFAIPLIVLLVLYPLAKAVEDWKRSDKTEAKKRAGNKVKTGGQILFSLLVHPFVLLKEKLTK